MIIIHGKGNVAGHRLAEAGAYVKKLNAGEGIVCVCVCVYVDVCMRSLHYGHWKERTTDPLPRLPLINPPKSSPTLAVSKLETFPKYHSNS